MWGMIHTDSQDSTPDLRNYMCFGCSSKQPLYTDEANKVIKICQDFAELIWSGKKEDGATLNMR